MALSTIAAFAQNTGAQAQTLSGSGISVMSINGQATVTWNGEKVFSGPAKGLVTVRSSNVNGTQYAAAFDEDTVIWENVPGAARQLGSSQGSPAGFDLQKFMDNLPKMIEELKKIDGQYQQNFNMEDLPKRMEELKKIIGQQQFSFGQAGPMGLDLQQFMDNLPKMMENLPKMTEEQKKLIEQYQQSFNMENLQKRMEELKKAIGQQKFSLDQVESMGFDLQKFMENLPKMMENLPKTIEELKRIDGQKQ